MLKTHLSLALSSMDTPPSHTSVTSISMPCDATPRYYIEKPRSGSKKIVTPNGEVISCEYTEDPHKATGTGFAPHWGSCRAAGSFKSREEHNG